MMRLSFMFTQVAGIHPKKECSSCRLQLIQTASQRPPSCIPSTGISAYRASARSSVDSIYFEERRHSIVKLVYFAKWISAPNVVRQGVAGRDLK